MATPSASSTADAMTAPTGITPASPAPLMPSGLSGDGVSMWSISIFGISVGVVREALIERSPDPLSDAALDLAFHHQGIDQSTAVVNDHVLEDLEPERLRVDAHVRGVAARRPRRPDRAEESGRLQTRLLALWQGRSRPRLGGELGRCFGATTERIAHRVGEHRDRSQRDTA